MFAIVMRRIGIVLFAAALVLLLSGIAFRREQRIGITLLIAAGLLFAYVVLRLSRAMFTASAAARRRARRRLIGIAVIPALILTPAVIESAPPASASLVLLTSVVWIALIMAWTSSVLVAERSTRASRHVRSRYLVTRAVARGVASPARKDSMRSASISASRSPSSTSARM